MRPTLGYPLAWVPIVAVAVFGLPDFTWHVWVLLAAPAWGALWFYSQKDASPAEARPDTWCAKEGATGE